jgi:zinc transporter ZupT
MNWYFWLAILMTLLGPGFYYCLSSYSGISRFFDGMSTMVLLGLVTLHILPESFAHSGFITMLSVTVGLLGPVLLSNLTKRKQCEIQKPFLIMSIFGLIAHNMLDGAALVVHPNAQNSIHMLALAVAIHRFLESMAIFKTLSKSFGMWAGILALLGMSFAMAGGFFFGEQLFTSMDEGFLHILQSLACGMIFHVVLHPHHIKEILSETNGKFAIKQSAGAFCGLLIAVLAYMFSPNHPHDHGSVHTHQSE